MDENKEMIGLINRLESYRSLTGRGVDIQLPKIVVVGAQSSGKSSVLDSLIGESILPRGSGTVTKRPISIQLVHTPNAEDEGVVFDEESSNSESPQSVKKEKNYDIVREKISQKMNENNGAIIDVPIIIRFYSSNVVDLTVVDLPGVKRLPSADEPSDLEQQILTMIRKYTNEKNAIILAISPANYDICNSDGLLLAREADPDGERTIGVLTKLDIMNEGTNARDLLTGNSKDVQLKLGMIGVVNRSQKDIDDNLSIESQLEKEKLFLQKTYPDLACFHGTSILRTRLQQILVEKIHACLPGLVTELEEKLTECKKRLSTIPDVMSLNDKIVLANNVIKEFEGNTKKEIDGTMYRPEMKHLVGGVKIKEAYEKHFPKEMDEAKQNTFSIVTDKMILYAFRNSGPTISFFDYPEPVFVALAEKQVPCIEGPSLNCAQRVHDEIIKVINRHTKTEILMRFPDLRNHIKSVATEMIEKNMASVKEEIKQYVLLQADNPFCLGRSFREKFSDLRRQVESVLNGEKNEKGAPSSANPVATSDERLCTKLEKPGTIQLVKDMATLYYNHVHEQCLDLIPKLIVNKLITQFSTKGRLGDELRVSIMENLDELIKLPAGERKTRERYLETKSLLEKALYEVKQTLYLSDFDDEERPSYENKKTLHLSDYEDDTPEEDSTAPSSKNASVLSLNLDREVVMEPGSNTDLERKFVSMQKINEKPKKKRFAVFR